MNIKMIQASVEKLVTENATVILTAGGVVGTVATGVLAWRGGYKTAEAFDKAEFTPIETPEGQTPIFSRRPLERKEQIVLALPHAAPPVVTGGLTVAAIVMSHRMSAQKAAALAAAYGLSREQFEEYRDKVAEKLTGNKRQQIDDEIAQDRVNRTPGSDRLVIIEGGDVLCFDQPTGRYFKSSVEKINRALNATNKEIVHHDHVSAGFFYDELGLPPTTWTEGVGWNSEYMPEITFSTVMTEDDKPCVAIDFTRLPMENYQRNLY